MITPEGELDLAAIGETVVDFISEEETDNLFNGKLLHIIKNSG